MKTCLVTGGPRGIGRATAMRAAAAGYSVAVAGLAEHRGDAEDVVAAIAEKGGKAIALSADVGREDEIVTMFTEVKSRLGPVDALVNAAGVSPTAKPDAYTFEQLDLLMRVNVTGLILCCREAIRQMDGRGGSIVNISSMAATIGGRPNAAAYAASKAAVDVYTTGVARDLAGSGIRMNTVRPGVIATAMTANLERDPALRRQVEQSLPNGRLGQPEEIAEVAVWLVSEAASLVTGAHVNAGGGGFLVAAST